MQECQEYEHSPHANPQLHRKILPPASEQILPQALHLWESISSGESPIDENFLFLVSTILEELKSHTSDDLLDSIDIVEGDLEVIQGMTVEEILEYFGWQP